MLCSALELGGELYLSLCGDICCLVKSVFKCPLLHPVVVLKQFTSRARRFGHNDHTTDSRLINVLCFLVLCADAKVLEDAFNFVVYMKEASTYCLSNEGYCPPTVN